MAISVNPTEETVQCEVCGNKVPMSEAKSAQYRGYQAYFCDINCLVAWEEQEARGDEGGGGA